VGPQRSAVHELDADKLPDAIVHTIAVENTFLHSIAICNTKYNVHAGIAHAISVTVHNHVVDADANGVT